ncbi:M20 metallopeptidase family protein [Dactylosporangium sp. CS-047395]|uniref:M20 metallopeptidase family protein n=1 Tax=Dactylosporangium sp. CS-047395 TaxID=3239936 RepID=UPI003D948A74
MILLRRELHQRPEPAGHEERTAAAVASRLTAAGIPVTTGVGGHGVVAVVEGGTPGPTIAYRADMDAMLTAAGPAHLCGHDVHTAIGVGIAQTLARTPFAGRAMVLFQPAEETLEGARAMLASGVFASGVPDEVYALHCGPYPVGTFGVMPGVGQPGQDTGHVEGGDAALVAAIEGLSTVRRPTNDAEFQRLFADLHTPDGPLRRFVFAESWIEPGSAAARFAVRAWPDDRYPELRTELHRLAGDRRIVFDGDPFPAMVCSAELSTLAAAHLLTVPGVSSIATMHAAFPFNGEDFGLFLAHAPGAMFFLGVGPAGVPHAPTFTVDERAIPLGVRAMTSLLLDRLAALARRQDGATRPSPSESSTGRRGPAT